MKKQLLLDFIDKYLGGTTESVTWESANNTLKTRFFTGDSVVGSISMNNFGSTEFDGHKLGIQKTSSLVKLLGVLQDEIEMSLQVLGDNPLSINFYDQTGIKVRFALQDLAVIPHVPNLKNEPTEFDAVIKINDDFANTFIKAKNALVDEKLFTVKSTGKKIQIIFGETSINANTITLNAEVESSTQMENISFQSELFKCILLANKGVDAKLKVSKDGVAVIEYKTADYTAKYYLMAKPAINTGG